MAASLAHRTADATVTILGTDDRPLPPGTPVTAAQRSHAFPFGCIGFDFLEPRPPHAQELAEAWFGLFNAATLPFYWAEFEPEPGAPRTDALRAVAEMLRERGVQVKGHPLAWHTLAPKWLLGETPERTELVLRERIRRDVTGFAGLIDTWDVINEVVIMPVFDKEDNAITRLCREKGRIPMIRAVFEEARAANPDAFLLLNDFDMSTAYECLIEGCLEAGIRIDALGLQSHMHQGYWGEERTTAVLDRFARYGLPLHLTETTLLSGHLMPPEIEDLNDYQIPEWPSTPEGEERQAEEMVRHYRTLVGHPAVQSINYWGLGDAGAWLGAPVGLVRADGTPKPAYHALRDLVRGEWWLDETELVTDDAGRVRVSGFTGDYEVTGPGGRALVTLPVPGPVEVTARLGS